MNCGMEQRLEQVGVHFYGQYRWRPFAGRCIGAKMPNFSEMIRVVVEKTNVEGYRVMIYIGNKADANSFTNGVEYSRSGDANKAAKKIWERLTSYKKEVIESK